MKFTLICDESGTSERFMVVGGLTLPRINHDILRKEILALKAARGFRPEGEFKWGKVSRGYYEHYQVVMTWFFERLKANQLRFRAHVVDTSSHTYRQYGGGDKEHAFYKIFYHLLLQSAKRLALEEESSNILILLDDKTNRYPFQLPVLKRTLNATLRRELKLENLVANVEPRQSSGPGAEPLIQIVDVLIGAIGYVRNGHLLRADASPAKKDMVALLQQLAGTDFHMDTAARAPFNLWTFDVKVAMERKREHQKKNRSKT